MTEYHILYQVEKEGSDLLFDRDCEVEAKSPQEAVNKLYNMDQPYGGTVYEVEAVQTYHEDDLGGYYEDCDMK